ncbi:hypothetical protein HGRIS_005958 [Hohenbuehelia grisea]|uniref:DUF4246 domain-containing protein n=1 Tax=Hohenbuehelia grisea TaxID=104357 RepID=A0ABR3K0T5_9AGAR
MNSTTAESATEGSSLLHDDHVQNPTSPIDIDAFFQGRRQFHRVTELIHAFCNAIRAKDDWCVKVLDGAQDLPMKWAKEAQLLGVYNEEDGVDNAVFQAISDLKAEARRILDLDHKIHTTSRSIPVQHIDVHAIEADVENAVKFACNAHYVISSPKLQEDIGVYASDGLVPKSLHKELVRQLDLLAACEPKDFHPGSQGKARTTSLNLIFSNLMQIWQVLDLIHPSLYPFVAGWSEVTDESMAPNPPNNIFKSRLSAMKNYDFESRYGWLPSVFRMSDDGQDVQIQSYINGLGSRERFPDLYRVIEKLFLVALPHFERTLSFEYEYVPTPSQHRWQQRHEARRSAADALGRIGRREWERILKSDMEAKAEEEEQSRKENEQRIATKAQEIQSASEIMAAEMAPSVWKGKELKVIIKAANYVLMPGDQYEGSWHMEGMPHERIVASAIYYYDTDPEIHDEGLGFRRLRDSEDDFPGHMDYRHEDFNVHIKPDDEPEIMPGEEQEESDPDAPSIRDYPSDWEETVYDGKLQPRYTSDLGAFVGLGSVPTTNIEHARPEFAGNGTGRMISFPNWIQHKVLTISNTADKNGPVKAAHRKILCFFLIDDDELPNYVAEFRGYTYTQVGDMKGLSSAEVPIQERGCNEATLRFLLPAITSRLIGKRIPPELVSSIIAYAHDRTMSREDAERHRANLMEDRRLKTGGYPRSVWEMDFSLCEH